MLPEFPSRLYDGVAGRAGEGVNTGALPQRRGHLPYPTAQGIFDSSRTLGARGYKVDKGTVMAIRIVQLGSPRTDGEGLRIGTVRRPPRGVPKTEFASRDYYDVWLPDVAPSAELVKVAQRAKDEKAWNSFVSRYRAEMKRPEASRLLDLLAALSHSTNLSVGCYCEDESRCHRSVLQVLLSERGAKLVVT